ncbi:DNA damage-inducible protein F [Zhongshania aliphaticivorans]|uniref:DNA damage-inducible protein F n=1 Tax=Zhongshania aliphaticivorans TaxID=1470434 RepID=A0A5S9PKL7_9GAMM|nr:MATE family efflux transporter [Zhongshania aliphaticivorans]CAA0104746.1 DNA damage-inducible protein F [Zhongshania aliphaticivorans]CAA0105007.1 DNA damage-inducible protein F [Zhongshania aliphaticivorans]
MSSSQQINRRIRNIAWPMILANLSVPLLGIVDTAILGHLDDSRYLSAVAISTSLLAFLYWGFGFLRMGTTGASAQTHNHQESAGLLIKALLLSSIIAILIFIIGRSFSHIGLGLMNTTENLLPIAQRYLHIRLYSAPAVLGTYVVIGWLIGQQQTRWPLIIAVASNLLNIALDYVLIIKFNQLSNGAAAASAISEYFGFALALWAVRTPLKHTLATGLKISWAQGPKLKQLLTTNFHLFIRTAALLSSLAFFTAQSAALGQNQLAANAILLQLMMISAYGLDGFAHAAEALVGEAYKNNNQALLIKLCLACAKFCAVAAFSASVILILFKSAIIEMMTDLPAVALLINNDYYWLAWLPLLCAPSYLLDGIYIGTLKTKTMQWCMLFSVAVIYLPLWALTQHLGNSGLWLAFTAFNIARGLSLAACFKYSILKKVPTSVN